MNKYLGYALPFFIAQMGVFGQVKEEISLNNRHPVECNVSYDIQSLINVRDKVIDNIKENIKFEVAFVSGASLKSFFPDYITGINDDYIYNDKDIYCIYKAYLTPNAQRSISKFTVEFNNDILSYCDFKTINIKRLTPGIGMDFGIIRVISNTQGVPEGNRDKVLSLKKLNVIIKDIRIK